MGRRKLPRPRCAVCGVELRGLAGTRCVRHANAAHGFGAHHSASAAARAVWDRREAERAELERLRGQRQVLHGAGQ